MDRIEAAAKAIAEVVYPVLSWDGLPRDAKDYYMKLARAASAVLSDEGLRKTLDAAARLAENNYRPWAQSGGADECPHGINVGIGCRECDEKTVKAALSRQAQDEPSQSVNYVSAPHDAKTMRCQSCDSEQWPQCPSCGALLIEKPESTQEPPSQQEASEHEEEISYRARQIWRRFVGIPITEPYDKEFQWLVDLLSGREAPKKTLTEAVQEARGNAGPPAVPVRFDAPSSVQPSTEDVVERRRKSVEDLMWIGVQLDNYYPATHNEQIILAFERGEKSRAGWHSWESVEKAIRKVRLTGNEIGWNTEKFLKEFSAVLEAESAERVTDPAVEAQTNQQSNDYRIGLDKLTDQRNRIVSLPLNSGLNELQDEIVLYFDVLEQILGEHFPLMAETRGKLADAQGDNKACITVSNEEYLALERVAREMYKALEARQEADAAWKNDKTAHNVRHDMTKKADDLARTALAAFDKAKEGK